MEHTVEVCFYGIGTKNPMVKLFQDIVTANTMAKNGYPLKSKETLLLTAVKGLESLEVLDTDPTVRLPLPAPLEAGEFSDWVIDIACGSDGKMKTEMMTNDEDEKYRGIAEACAQNPNEIFVVLSTSEYRKELEFLYETAQDTKAENMKEIVKASAVAGPLPESANCGGPRPLQCEECRGAEAARPASPAHHPGQQLFRPWI